MATTRQSQSATCVRWHNCQIIHARSSTTSKEQLITLKMLQLDLTSGICGVVRRVDSIAFSDVEEEDAAGQQAGW
jgi:hypothetical protein